MKDKWLKITQDGVIMYVDMPPSDVHDDSFAFLHALYDQLNCDCINIVRVPFCDRFFPRGFEPVLIVDDCALLKDDWVQNIWCTWMYAGDLIAGHALLGTRKGPEIYPCPKEVYESFLKDFGKFVSEGCPQP